MILSLNGCAALSKWTAPAAQPLEQAAVAAAVATAVGQNVTAAKGRAQVIANIAKQVLAIDNGTSALLPDIQLVINAKIAALKLPQEDVVLAELLTQAFSDAVAQQISNKTAGAISPQTQVAIATVCNWIIIDTTAYGAT